jgi:tetratricopeptide (TPR) repeat protein
MNLNFIVGGALQVLAGILADRGRVDEARALGERSLAITSAQGDHRFRGYAEADLAAIEYLAGNHARSERYARAAAETFQGMPGAQPLAFALLARALLVQDQNEEALHTARASYEGMMAVGVVEDGEMTIRLALGECLLATGRAREAQTILEEAASRLHAQAAAIEDGAARESFLTGIPEHRRILELAPNIVRSDP